MESVHSWGQPMSGDVNMAFDYPQPGSSVTISSGPCGNDSLLEFTGSSRGDGHTSFYHPNNTCSETFHSPSNPGSALVSPVEYGHITSPFFQQSLTPGGSSVPQYQQYAMYQQYQHQQQQQQQRHHQQQPQQHQQQQHQHQQQQQQQQPQQKPQQQPPQPPPPPPMEPHFPGNLRVQTPHYHSEHNSPVYGSYPRPLSAGLHDNEVLVDNDFTSQRRPSHPSIGRRASRFSDVSEISNPSTILSPTSNKSSVSSPRTTASAPVRTRQQQYERTRQKNREAASKCREKTKKNVDDLRVRERELNCQKQVLMAVANELKDEVLALKHEILLHGNCDCEYIQKYLESAASQIA